MKKEVSITLDGARYSALDIYSLNYWRTQFAGIFGQKLLKDTQREFSLGSLGWRIIIVPGSQKVPTAFGYLANALEVIFEQKADAGGNRIRLVLAPVEKEGLFSLFVEFNEEERSTMPIRGGQIHQTQSWLKVLQRAKM